MTDIDTAEWNAAIEQAARTAEGTAEVVSGNLYESLCHKIAVDIRALSRTAPAARETVGALRAGNELAAASANIHPTAPSATSIKCLHRAIDAWDAAIAKATEAES